MTEAFPISASAARISVPPSKAAAKTSGAMQGDWAAEIHYELGSAFWGTASPLKPARRHAMGLRAIEACTTCATDHNANCRVLKKIGLIRDQFIELAFPMKTTGQRTDAWSFIWKRIAVERGRIYDPLLLRIDLIGAL